MHASTAPAGHEPAGVMSQTCPSCHAGDIVTDYSAGDVICRGCGLVLGDHVIDDQIEWRTFADGNPNRGDPNRIGGKYNAALGTAGLATEISRVGDSGSGDSPLTRMHERLATNEERRVKAAFGRLSSLADTLGLPERVRGRAQQIYHDAVTKSKRLVRGKLNVTAAAAVFAACRVERVARSVKEVAAAATLKKHHVMQRFSALKRELELDVTTVTASDFIAPLCNRLRLPMRLQKAVESAAKAFRRATPSQSRQPATIAACATFLVCELTPGKQGMLSDIAVECRVSAAAVWSAYKSAFPKLSKVVPQSMLTPAAMARLPDPEGRMPASQARRPACTGSRHTRRVVKAQDATAVAHPVNSSWGAHWPQTRKRGYGRDATTDGAGAGAGAGTDCIMERAAGGAVAADVVGDMGAPKSPAVSAPSEPVSPLDDPLLQLMMGWGTSPPSTLNPLRGCAAASTCSDTASSASSESVASTIATDASRASSL